jgi:hypothetical protein
MHRIDVSGQIGKGGNVLIGDFLGVTRLHAHGKILEIISVAERAAFSIICHVIVPAAHDAGKIAKPLLHCNISEMACPYAEKPLN